VLSEEVVRAQRDPKTTAEEAYAELKRHVGNPGSRAVFDAALKYIDFTNDPLRASIESFAEQAAALGLCGANAANGLFG
jgi:hypothetical protein